jgi:hypothetical protein
MKSAAAHLADGGTSSRFNMNSKISGSVAGDSNACDTSYFTSPDWVLCG